MLKKILPFTGLIAAVLAIVSMILLMATPVATMETNFGVSEVSGIAAIFGKTAKVLSVDVTIKPGWAGTLAWVLTLVSVIALIAAAVLQFVLKKAPQIGGILAIVAGAALVLGGVFSFLGFNAVNQANATALGTPFDSYTVGGGWVTAGILSIAGGCVALLDCVLGLVASLKK